MSDFESVNLEVDEDEVAEIKKEMKLYSIWMIVGIVFLIVLTLLFQAGAFLLAYKESSTIKYSTVIGLTPYLGPFFLIFKLAFAKSISALILALLALPCVVMAIFSANCKRNHSLLYNSLLDNSTSEESTDINSKNELPKKEKIVPEKSYVKKKNNFHSDRDDVINPILDDFIAIAKQVEQETELEEKENTNQTKIIKSQKEIEEMRQMEKEEADQLLNDILKKKKEDNNTN